MPQESIHTKLQLSVIYADENFSQKEYERLKNLLNKGQREQVINDLKTRYQKDRDLAYKLAYKLNIDLEKELGIIHYDNFSDENTSYSIVLDYNTKDQELFLNLESKIFSNLPDTIKHYSQYKGNFVDTLMSGNMAIYEANCGATNG